MSGNIRIARNAIYLYVRMIVNMVVGLFTVRVMLEALGVEDYGLQAVAGGVLGMFSFIVEGLGTSTSRFITYELGRGDVRRTNEMFNTAMIVFTAMGLLMVLLGETVGLWMLTEKLDIPAGREGAAMVVFQLSVLSTFIGLPQAPYNACLVAHEKFNVTAWLSLYGSFGRLGILYLVRLSSFDHLILYSVAMFALGLSSLLFSRLYCIRRFPESKLRLTFNRELFRPMLKFSFWETFGGISRTLKGTGFQMAINMFYGVLLNAAIGIGMTVSGAVTGLAFTVTSAFKPVIVKQFARREYDDMKASIRLSTLISMVLYGIFAVPLLVEIDYVLALWLTEIPDLARELCIIQLLFNVILMAYLVPAESLKSMGHNVGVNLMQCLDGFITMGMVLVALYAGWPPIVACAIFTGGLLWNFAVTMWLVKRRLGLRYVTGLIGHTVVKVLLIELLAYCVLRLVHELMGPSLLTLAVVCALSVIVTGGIAVRFLLEPAQVRNLRIYVRNMFIQPNPA